MHVLSFPWVWSPQEPSQVSGVAEPPGLVARWAVSKQAASFQLTVHFTIPANELPPKPSGSLRLSPSQQSQGPRALQWCRKWLGPGGLCVAVGRGTRNGTPACTGALSACRSAPPQSQGFLQGEVEELLLIHRQIHSPTTCGGGEKGRETSAGDSDRAQWCKCLQSHCPSYPLQGV